MNFILSKIPEDIPNYMKLVEDHKKLQDIYLKVLSF